MNVAIITDGVVENSCVFDDILTAQEFLTANVWPGAEVVIELPESYGIGDSYNAQTGEWTKAPAPEEPEEPEPPEPEPTLEERLEATEEENRQLKAQVKAQSQSLLMLEDCLVEMAGVVYA